MPADKASKPRMSCNKKIWAMICMPRSASMKTHRDEIIGSGRKI
jgi:hypothetical protein